MSAERETGLQEVQELADRRYMGRAERAFVDWTVRCLLADMEDLEDDDFTGISAIDGPGDLGIDAAYLDELNNRILFVQCKFQDRISRGEVQEFRQAIESLLDEAYVLEHGNEAIKDVYPDIQEPLLGEDLSIWAVFAGGESVAPAAATWATRQGSQPWQFDFAGESRRKDFQLQVLTIQDLIHVRRALTVAAATPTVTLRVAEGPSGACAHAIGGEFRTVQATVPATDVVAAYGTYRSGIFRYNPRGPQGSNKVNKEIAGSLRDPATRRNFHLLNNGLTIVCDSVVSDPDLRSITVTDFQIVNGCQTVFTLHALREQVSDEVMLSVRIVEGENWAKIIAKTTNSQTAVRPEQLASLGPEHNRIKEAFDRLEAPWFYERQQGSIRFHSAVERQLHRARYANRVVTIKELGQFASAFLGYPILAKYDLKALFERSEGAGQRLYTAIFGPDGQADQLLLPVLIGRRVQAAVKDRMARLEAERQEQGLRPEDEGFTESDWLPYSRMHLVALVGEILRSRHRQQMEASGFLPGVQSRTLRASIDDWFLDLFAIARDAVRYRIDVAREADQLTNLREFFRNDDILARMTERARELDRERR